MLDGGNAKKRLDLVVADMLAEVQKHGVLINEMGETIEKLVSIAKMDPDTVRRIADIADAKPDPIRAFVANDPGWEPGANIY